MPFSTNVTLTTILEWTAQPAATSYEISAQDGVGTNILPTTDVGNVTSLPVSTWLTGQPTNADYQLFVRAKNSGGVGPWGQLDVHLVPGLVAPDIHVQ